MKKSLTVCSVLLFAFAAWAQGPQGRGGPGFERGFRFGAEARTPVTGAPYTAVESTQFQQTLAGGNQITRTEQTKVSRDSSGRVRMERTVTPPGATTPLLEVSIFDPVARTVSELHPATLKATTMTLPPAKESSAGEARSHTRPANSNVQRATENLGTQTINGVAATGTRMTETIAAGAVGNAQAIQVVREVWESVDLKVPVQIKSTDPRFGTSVMNLTSIVTAEPDASLFVVPSNYTVTPRTFGGPRGMHREPAAQ